MQAACIIQSTKSEPALKKTVGHAKGESDRNFVYNVGEVDCISFDDLGVFHTSPPLTNLNMPLRLASVLDVDSGIYYNLSRGFHELIQMRRL